MALALPVPYGHHKNVELGFFLGECVGHRRLVSKLGALVRCRQCEVVRLSRGRVFCALKLTASLEVQGYHDVDTRPRIEHGFGTVAVAYDVELDSRPIRLKTQYGIGRMNLCYGKGL